MEAKQRELSSELSTFIDTLGEKCGVRDTNGKILTRQDGLPQCRDDAKAEYEKTFDGFMARTATIDMPPLPLEYFSHIEKAPLDWASLEEIAVITPEFTSGVEASHLKVVPGTVG